MNLHNLKPAKGSTHNSKRVGRGQGSGKGGTATRGTKGAQARAGYEHKVGFEGGQMPIQRRLPKFGFNNPTRVEYVAINLSALQALSEKLGTTVITVDTLRDAGVVHTNELVRFLEMVSLQLNLRLPLMHSQSQLSRRLRLPVEKLLRSRNNEEIY